MARHESGETKSFGVQARELGCLLMALPLVVLIGPLVLIVYLWDRWELGRLRRRFDARWGSEGRRGLLIYSNSPNWQHYIERRWLPALGDRVVLLNWSERATWRKTHPLEAELFRRYLGDSEFNPAAVLFERPEAARDARAFWRALRDGDLMGILFPSRAQVRVIRFWQAFRDYKHGKDMGLRRAERELFEALDATDPGPPPAVPTVGA